MSLRKRLSRWVNRVPRARADGFDQGYTMGYDNFLATIISPGWSRQVNPTHYARRINIGHPVTLPRETVNQVELLILDIVRNTGGALDGTSADLLRRTLSDAIQAADDAHSIKEHQP